MEVTTNNYEATQKAGEAFGKKLQGGDIIFLYGNLGAGKTTFMQGLAKGLGISHRIISPTFIIVRSYEVPNYSSSEARSLEDSRHFVRTIQKLYHIDLYRTETRHDLESIGLADMLHDKHAVIAVEWPEKFGTLPDKRYDIHFETIDENTRRITIEKYE